MRTKRIIILGAGLSGLSTAFFLNKKGLSCKIFEKEDTNGGLCRSQHHKGFTFDFTGHLLHFGNKRVGSFVKGLLRGNLLKHKRNAWIYSSNRLTRYPFQINLYGLPQSITKSCLFDFIKAKINGSNSPDNFYEWCVDSFGESITNNFMVPYNEKFWKVSLRKLSYEWADKFIVVPSLRQVVEGTLEENKRNFGYHSFFWYPKKGGIVGLVNSLSKDLKNIHNGFEAVGIDPGKKLIKFSNGHIENYDLLINTMPLPSLGAMLNGSVYGLKSSFRKLKWLSVYNLNLGVKGILNTESHWIYFPDKRISFYRLGFFNNFSSVLAPQGKSALYAEVSYSKNKPLEKSKINARIIKDLIKLGILKDRKNIEVLLVNDIEYAYPVYDKNWRSVREDIINNLFEEGIVSVGRFGGWQYMSMQDVIQEAKAVAEIIEQKV